MWRRSAEPVSVQQFSREESIAFLQKRTGRGEPVAAEALSAAVGDLPLALAQAAAYAESTGISIKEYVDLCRSYSKDLLEPVEATWRISFQRLQRENPSALDLLRLIAYVAPDNIPRDLLQSTAANPLAFNKSVEALRRYSLIETGANTISVHRLVQEVTRNGLEKSEQRRWAEAAVELVVNPCFLYSSPNLGAVNGLPQSV